MLLLREDTISTYKNFYLQDTNIAGTESGNAGEVTITTGEQNVHDGAVKLFQHNSSNYVAILPPKDALAGNRVVRLRDKSGIIAYTSDLSSYLPLTGGMLTGNLTLSTDKQITASSVSRKIEYKGNGIALHATRGSGYAMGMTFYDDTSGDAVLNSEFGYTNTGGGYFYFGATYNNANGIVKANKFFGNVDGNIKNTLTNPSARTIYYIPFFTGSTESFYSPRTNNGIKYATLEGTNSAVGCSELILGNSIAKGTVGNKKGRMSFFGEGAGYTDLLTANTSATNYTITLPAATGTVALTSSTVAVANKLGTATKGSATKPIYLSAGTPTACSRDLVGMTMTGSVKPTPTAVTAGTGAEIFNDYRARTFESDGTVIQGNVASGNYSHVEGEANTASGPHSHVGGYMSAASAECAFAFGEENVSSKEGAVTFGRGNINNGRRSFICGDGNECSKDDGIVVGSRNSASNSYNAIFGSGNSATGLAVFMTGNNNIQSSGHCMSYFGHYAEDTAGGNSNGTSGSVIVAGNGMTNSSRSNCFRVTFAGQVYGLASFKTSGADYAEYYEWDDGNICNEDRIGYFVTMNGGKILKASSPDDYILGVVSGNPCIIGNADEDWLGRWEHDEFGRFVKEYYDEPIMEEIEVEGLVLDDNGAPIPKTEKKIVEVEVPICDENGKPLPLMKEIFVDVQVPLTDSAGNPVRKMQEQLIDVRVPVLDENGEETGNFTTEIRTVYVVELDESGRPVYEMTTEKNAVYTPELDKQGNPIYQTMMEEREETVPVFDAEGNTVYETMIETRKVDTGERYYGWRYKANPNYDNTQEYVERQDRKEWDAIGMVGVLAVRDDGTCQVNGFCKPAAGGIATAAESQIAGSTYRVIERVSESVIKIIFR